MKDTETGLCMDVDGLKGGDDLKVAVCVEEKATQRWEFVKI